MPALNGMTERRETSDLQPRTEDKPMKLTPGTAGKDLIACMGRHPDGKILPWLETGIPTFTRSNFLTVRRIALKAR